MGWQIIFALCASFLVQKYAIYAKHSGIPEIKTVLGGFVIRRFMGSWTLVIKSIGLVSTFEIGICLMIDNCSALLSHPVCGLERKAPLSMWPVAVQMYS
jgi:Voltage gated chloride channel